MKHKLFAILWILLLSTIFPIAFYAQTRDQILVNLVLKMDDGKIGKRYFSDFVEQDEVKDNETLEDALKRINHGLMLKLREGLHEKSNELRYGEFPKAYYTLSVTFLRSNEDGQRASFSFVLKDAQDKIISEFEKKDGGGTFGSKLNLLGDCLIGVGKKSAKELERTVKNSQI